MDGQLVYVIIAGLILVVNALALFWLSDVKKDIRELRQHYVDALKEVTELKLEVSKLNLMIDNLKNKIFTLRAKSKAEEL